MGYDVHITRKENWFDEGGHEIKLEEWKTYVSFDEEMRIDNFAEAKTDNGAIVRVDSEGLAVWTGYSGHEKNGNMAQFDYRNGNITVKNPDDEILDKMVTISKSLHAKVQGDEGEVYPVQEEALSSSKQVTINENSNMPMCIGIGLIIIMIVAWYFTKSS